MASATELREEAAHLRTLLLSVTDPAALAAIREMIDELENRAKEMDNGGATDDWGRLARSATRYHAYGMARGHAHPHLPGMSINWQATLWRGLEAEARKAARKVGNSGVKLQTVMLAAHCVTKAVRAERTARDEQGDKAT